MLPQMRVLEVADNVKGSIEIKWPSGTRNASIDPALPGKINEWLLNVTLKSC